MGQYWKWINLDQRQGLPKEFGIGLKLGEFLFTEEPDHLVWMLAYPRLPTLFRRSVERGHSTDMRDLGALNLPFDILQLLFKQFRGKTLADALCLSLTNSLLCEIGQHRIRLGLLGYHAPWYLDRVICVGDYHQGDDMPPGNGVIKDHEHNTLRGSQALSDEEEVFQSRLYSADDTQYNFPVMHWYWESIFRGLYRLSKMEYEQMKAMVIPDYSWDGRPETEWVLCSWTAAEYVRASVVAKLTDSECRGPWTTQPLLGLGHVLVTQISWSSDKSTSLAYEGPIHRGRWAGHHVAIITKNQLTEDTSFNVKGHYTDVTDRVLKEVLDIWRPEYPSILAEHLRFVSPDELHNPSVTAHDNKISVEGDHGNDKQESNS